MDYVDFELEIGPGSGGAYPVAVVHSPAGEARGMMSFPYDERALEDCLENLQIALLRSGGWRRSYLSPEERAVQAFGRTLFDALLIGDVRRLFHESQQGAEAQDKVLRLKLRIQAPELAALPWEFLYDARRAEYVCLFRNTSLMRYLDVAQTIQPLDVKPPLRVLGMVVSPRDLAPLDVERERQRVEGATRALQAEGLLELTWLEAGTWRDLQWVMRRGSWHVFHFVGHGGFDRETDEGFVALADDAGESERLTASRLGRLLVGDGLPRLAVLNGPGGARGGVQDVFSRTAVHLVREGIPAVLATQYEITDRAAIELAQAFYRSLAEGSAVDAAVTEARKAIRLAVDNTVEWGAPSLYTCAADGLLFNIQEREAAIAEARRRRRRKVAAGSQDPLRRQPEPGAGRGTWRHRGFRDGVLAHDVSARQSFEPELLHVPAGEFLMGSDPGRDRFALSNEKPQHSVYLPDYYLARMPVTNAQYLAFVTATEHEPPEHWGSGKPPTGREEHPVVNVSWYDAMAYCRWLAEVTGKPYRLPSEAEWEKGARGVDGRLYPWGDSWDPERCNSREGMAGDTTPAGAYPQGASPFGLLDMTGNVWEWTMSLWGEDPHEPQFEYPYDPDDGREDIEAGISVWRVLRGGSCIYNPYRARAAYRFRLGPNRRNLSYGGFRCCVGPMVGL